MADPFYVQSYRYILVRFLCKKMRLELTSLHLSDIASCWASAILLSSWVNWWWLVDLEYNLYKMLTHWLCWWTNQYMTNSRCEYNRVVWASLCNTNKYHVTFTPETISMRKYRLAFSHFQLLACSQLDATHFQLLAFSHFQLYQQILYHLFSFYMLWNINQGLKFLWQENWT